MRSLAAHLATACILLSGLVVGAPAAQAQAAGVCQEGPTLLEKRRALIARLNDLGKGKKQVHPNVACKAFGELVSNGTATIKWLETNGDWCQAPGGLRDGMKADHERALKIRGQACDAAKKLADMERKAKQQQQSGGPGTGGLLGGDGLTGPVRLPRGAL